MKDTKTTYRGYTIEWDADRAEHIAYPAEEGIQHDYDQEGDSTRYCGNCLWSRDMESLEAEIDEKIIASLEGQVRSADQRADGLLQEIAYQKAQLAIARQCIEACREEFQHLSNKQQELANALPPVMHSGAAMAVFNHMITLCSTALENTK
jgi:hypothetical protein